MTWIRRGNRSRVPEGDADTGERIRLAVPHKTPKNGELPANYQQANRGPAAVRALDERGFATLRNRHVLDRYRACPRRVATTARAIHILETEAAIHLPGHWTVGAGMSFLSSVWLVV